MYDISVKSTFDNIPKWINFIRTIENTTLVLCGNKIDLSNREVKKEKIISKRIIRPVPFLGFLVVG